eukprot:g8949.t1
MPTYSEFFESTNVKYGDPEPFPHQWYEDRLNRYERERRAHWDYAYDSDLERTRFECTFGGQDNPDLFLHDRASEQIQVHSSIRDGAAGSSFSLMLPNKVAVEDRRKEGGLITENEPPFFFDEDATKALRADVSLAPDVRHGQSSTGDMTWEAAIAFGASLPKPDETVHVPAEGDTSDEEKTSFDQHVAAIKAGTFAPVSSGQMNRSTVTAYEKQFSSKCRPLLRACGLSGKRKNVSGHAITLLQKAFSMCGDFPQSRHAYLSQVKGYIELSHPLSAASQRAYGRAFKALMKSKSRSFQQKGFRASDMILMSKKIGESKKTREAVVMIFQHEGKSFTITAELALRFIIVCWCAFLRPDDAAHTSRSCSKLTGESIVAIHSSKTDQQGLIEAQAIFQCNCRSAPVAPIPLCPVCALADTDWEVMQRMMKIQADAKKKAKEQRIFDDMDIENADYGLEDLHRDELRYPSEAKWSEAIRNLVSMAGIPNPRVGADASRGRMGRLTWNTYSIRVGGAQSARDGGADEDMIMALGRWLSPRVKEHYKGLSACLPDVVRIEWPIRRGHLYSQSTNFNTNSDWASAVQDAINAAAKSAKDAVDPLIQEAQQRQAYDNAFGKGKITEAAQKELMKSNAIISPYRCLPSQFLAMNRALETLQFSSCFCRLTAETKQLLQWSPIEFLAAAFANKVVSEKRVKTMLRYIETTIAGDILVPAEERETLDEAETHEAFWKASKFVFADMNLPEVTSVQGETPVEYYTRQVEAAFKTELRVALREELRRKMADAAAHNAAESKAAKAMELSQKAMNMANTANQKQKTVRERDDRRDNGGRKGGGKGDKDNNGGGAPALTCTLWMQSVPHDPKTCKKNHRGPLDRLYKVNIKEKLGLTSKQLLKLAEAQPPNSS